jgi:hypothetical protein
MGLEVESRARLESGGNEEGGGRGMDEDGELEDEGQVRAHKRDTERRGEAGARGDVEEYTTSDREYGERGLDGRAGERGRELTWGLKFSKHAYGTEGEQHREKARESNWVIPNVWRKGRVCG